MRRIGIDGAPLLGRGGISRYLAEMLPCLDRLVGEVRFVLYVEREIALALPSERWSVRVVPRRLPSSYLWLRYRVAKELDRDGIDLFWGVRSLLPAYGARQWITTVHDLNVKFAPSTMPLMTLVAHKMWMREDLVRADAVLAVSHGTARKVREIFGVHVMGIVRPGVRDDMRPCRRDEVARVREKYGIAGPYVLHVGTIEPRKNIGALIEAVGRLRREGGEKLEIVLAGGMGWKAGAIRRMIRERSFVRWLGPVPDEDLPALYSGAAAVVVPSLYEGYGIPAAEARACGAPVVATDMAELRESAGDRAIFVHPTAEGVAGGILKAIHGRRPPAEIRSTWVDAGRRMAQVVRTLLSQRAR